MWSGDAVALRAKVRPRWSVESTTVKSAHKLDTDYGSLTVKLLDPTSGKKVTMSVLTPIDTVSDTAVFGDEVAVMGKAGRASAVVRLNITSRRLVDQFFCYGPRVVSSRWIVAVEFYFSSLAATATDVVILYDLSKSPALNRQGKGASRLGEKQPTGVGRPVFPEWNATHMSYDNYNVSTTLESDST